MPLDSNHIYRTRTDLEFWDPVRCTIWVSVPAGTLVNLDPWINPNGGHILSAGQVAHVLDGPHKDWVRSASARELEAVSPLELLAEAAE